MPGSFYMQQNKIRVAILITGYKVQAWQHLMLQKISASAFAEIVLVILCNNVVKTEPKSPGKSFLLKTYVKLESRFIKQKSALKAKDLSLILKDIPSVNIALNISEYSLHETGHGDIIKIMAYQPDVVISLNEISFRSEILGIAKYGIWAYDPPCEFSNVSFINTITSSDSYCGIALKKYDLQSPEGAVLYESFSAKNIFLSKSINWLYWKAASFAIRKLKKIYWNRSCAAASENSSVKSDFNSNIVSFLVKHFFSALLNKISHRSQTGQWILYYNTNNKNPLEFNSGNYKKLQPPPDRFWADPCLFTLNNIDHYIFIEEYIYQKKKAHISVFHIDENNEVKGPYVVLEKEYHLSYPFVFRNADTIFMVPETSANKTIELYRCVSFPGKWEFVMNLMENVHAVDTTIHFTGNKYWMFAGIRENDGASDWDELCVFYADALLTNEWHPHSCNPVVSDVRKARPAGNMFSRNGKLYRPSQDCSQTYGYAVNINEIISLSVEKYTEKKVASIAPWQDDITAVHSYFTSGDISVIDARIKAKIQ